MGDYYTERFHEGGVPLDPIGAVATMIKCGIALSDINLIHTVNDFSKNIVETIPDFSFSPETKKKPEKKNIAPIFENSEKNMNLTKKTQLEVESEANMFVLAGDKLVKDGKSNLAIQNYREAIRLKPDYTEIHFQLSLLYAEQKKFIKALHELNIAIEQEPEYPGFYYNRGLLKIQLFHQLKQEAIQDFLDFQKREPESSGKVQYLLKSLKEN